MSGRFGVLKQKRDGWGLDSEPRTNAVPSLPLPKRVLPIFSKQIVQRLSHE